MKPQILPLVEERCAGTLLVFELNILTKTKSLSEAPFPPAGAQSEVIFTTEMLLLV